MPKKPSFYLLGQKTQVIAVQEKKGGEGDFEGVKIAAYRLQFLKARPLMKPITLGLEQCWLQ